MYNHLERYIPPKPKKPFIVGAGIVLAIILVAGGIVLYSAMKKDVIPTNPQTTITPPPAEPAPERPTSFENELERTAVQDLQRFGQWLADNKAAGFIGEFGWTYARDTEAWNAVADKWLREAHYHDIWATSWAAGSWWGGYPLAVYSHREGDRSLDTANAQAAILERYRSRPSENKLRGTNLAGMEFGTEAEDSFSNANPGEPGEDYFYEPAQSLAYLKSRSVDLIRLPFRWERIQPQLGGELNDREIEEITKILDAANQNGIKVILDLHNYGVYKTDSSELQLGASLPHDRLADVWLKLSEEFRGHNAVVAYGLMNEPHDLPPGTYGSPARNWEVASQAALSALRQAGDNKLIMVAGYDWSSLVRWQKNHPKGWITDPANSFRYEAHHYWDNQGAGYYNKSFSEELANIRR